VSNSISSSADTQQRRQRLAEATYYQRWYHRYFFGARARCRRASAPGYDIGGARHGWGWIGEVKVGYPDVSDDLVLIKALDQCRRIVMAKGLAGRARLFAVYLPSERKAHPDTALVLYETEDGTLGQMEAKEFRMYLEAEGVVRLD